MKTQIKESTLAQLPHLKDKVLSLIEASFEYPSEYQFKVDFAPLMNENNHQNLHLLHMNDEIIGHIGVLEKKLIFKDNEIPVVFMGGIAIDKKYQGKGLFMPFFNNVINHYAEHVGALFLWSNLLDMYKKAGFFPTIGQLAIDSSSNEDEFMQTKWSELSEEQFTQMQELYRNETKKIILPKRSKNDWELIRQIESSQVFIKTEKDMVSQYYIKNKGADLGGIIHEVVPQGIVHAGTQWSPEIYELKQNAYEIHYMVNMRVGNPNLLKRFIQNVSDIKIHQFDEDVSFSIDGENQILSREQFFEVIWGPGRAQDIIGDLPPFFIFGVDSI